MFSTVMAVSVIAAATAQESTSSPEASTLSGKCLQCVLYGNVYCTDVNNASVNTCITAADYATDQQNGTNTCPTAAQALSQCPSSFFVNDATTCPGSFQISDANFESGAAAAEHTLTIPVNQGCQFSFSSNFSSYSGLAGFQFKFPSIENVSEDNEADPFYVITSGNWDSTTSAPAEVNLLVDGEGRYLLESGETKQFLIINQQEDPVSVTFMYGQAYQTAVSAAVFAASAVLAYVI